MLLIPCPWCGPRSEDEFEYGGDATIECPDGVSDADWVRYLYLRKNPKGHHVEWWFHQNGCGSWFRAVRDTVDHRIRLSTQEERTSEFSRS